MTECRDDTRGGAEERIDRDLTDALRAQPLGVEALARIEARVRTQWRELHAARYPTGAHRKIWLAVAAGVCSVALLLVWVTRPPATAALFGSIARPENGRMLLDCSNVGQRVPRVGDVLRSGDRVSTNGIALVCLRTGGNLRIGAETVVDILGPSDVELLRGMIYVDHPPAAPEASPLRVHSRAGTIEHVGTAFEVFSGEQIVRVRVREGQVRLRNAGHDTVARAGTELVATAAGVISEGPIALDGSPWRWIAAAAPAYEIEGRPLLGFLEFESRELGYQLVFADARAKQLAQSTILHGTVRGRDPLDAVSSVLATTSLSYSIHGNTLQVRSGDST